MPSPSESDEQDPFPYSFDKPQQQAQRKRKPTEEDESLSEEVLDEIDEGLGCSERLLGCGWSLIRLPFRLVWKVISEIF
jgi:hypothetical protein